MGRVIRKLSEPDEVVLIGNPGTTDDPAPTDVSSWAASSQYDTSRYTVRAWSGSAWQTVASRNGNTKHIVRLAFAPVTTDRIRVIPADDASNGQTANDNLVSLTEIEVRSPAGAGEIRAQRFDVWGKLEQAAGSVPTYGYTGREPDATGLIHYRARYYHPELGRFVSRDPLGLSAGINPYAYADGNPVLFNDPDGLMAALAWNSANQYYNDYQVGTRVQGALQFGAGLGMGALGTGVGVTTGWTGLGAVGGGALIALGSDQMSAGFQTLVSGKSTPSLLNQGLQAAGASPTQAAWGEAAITIGASGGVSMLSQSGRSFVQTAGVADDVFAAKETTRVGRWMSQAEHDAMKASGKVQESFSGTTHVASPADASAFINQAKPGSLYVEFNVPTSSLKATNQGWSKVMGPNSLEGRLAARKGQPIPQMPAATDIVHSATRLP